LRESLSKAENSKAAGLQASLQQLPLTAIRRIPKYLVNEEKNLKASITRLDVLLSSGNDSEQTAATQRSLVDAHIKLSRVHQELEKQPAYRELYKSNSIDLANIQKNILTENEAVVSYYFTTSALIVFFVATDTICYRRVAEMSIVKNAIRNFRSYMDGEAVERSQIENTEKLLYDKLIAPVLPFLVSKKKLIIIPHNELAYLPFETMADSSGHHVLDDFSTSYNYSIVFLQPSTTSKKNKKVVAFAPYAGRETFLNGLPAIPASAEEVGSLNGSIFIDSAATKQRFVEESATAGIAHLATHASASDSLPIQSYIAFYPAAASDTSFRLYEPEIYNLDLRSSSLVVLSACETGKGKLVHGEGILSLSRAFSYAGCPSIITSLWKADDKATAYICKHLYGYLDKGFSIDVALQKAKQDYLHDKDIPTQFKLPRYWAHLVLVGDTTPLYQSSKNIYLFGLAVFIILLCGILYWWQKKTRPPGRP
jgi:CHAT domain-containing protein